MTHLDAPIRRLLDQQMIALWLSPECDDGTIRAAMTLPWKAIWSGVEPRRLQSLLNEEKSRTYRLIDSKSDAPPPGARSDVVVVYDISQLVTGTSADVLRKHRRAEELENEVEGWPGLLVHAGPFAHDGHWLSLVEALAPTAYVFVEAENIAGITPSSRLTLVSWVGGLSEFFRLAGEYLRERERRNVLDLKDARGIEINPSMLDSLSEAWELLARGHTDQPSLVTQQDFDAFLSGDVDWTALSADVAYQRGAVARFLARTDNASEQYYDPIIHVCERIRKLDHLEVDPFDTVEQVLLFAEPGSGCTTLLRQIALAVAREGYPTLITRPHPRRLAPESLSNFVIYVQDIWAETRRGRGSGAGTLPVCLVLDVDAEVPAHFARFMRSLSGDLHRKVLIVRALQKSDREIEEARGVLRLISETKEAEILALGRHLGAFCRTHGLSAIPSDSEWHAFYGNFARVRSFPTDEREIQIETPPLFLIGLYPFIKERVRDERSLERYLFRRWNEISDEGARRLVEILATAGAHGIAVPFESLMRDGGLESALFGRLKKEDQRLVDFFCRWVTYGWQKRNWALYIRHPAFGLLLMRMLRPAEADTPFGALLPILGQLWGTEADRWLAQQLAYTFGRKFNAEARAFSLEIDTAVQRAARAIFQAFPDDIRNTSRSVCHHNARFHIHFLHACLKAIEYPISTHLPESVVREMATGALQEATALLEKARAIPDNDEKISNVLNTLAASITRLAQVYAARGERKIAREYFTDAVEHANEAIAHDAANGHALSNLVSTILYKFEKELIDDPHEAADLFEMVEDRLETLVRLHEVHQWRNTDEAEADFRIERLIQRQHEVARRIGFNPKISALATTSGVAQVMLEMREIVGTDTLRAAFLDRHRAPRLRNLRDRLLEIDNKSVRAWLLLYKLYLNDSTGRLEYALRMEILSEIERKSTEEYDSYRHDHAALLCQAGTFEAGERLFTHIRQMRDANRDQWFWVNERLLVTPQDGRPIPKRHVVQVTDARMGWARFERTSIRVKIQLRQFGDLTVGQYLNVYIRFRLNGLQAIDARMAKFDFEAMGHDPSSVSWIS